MQRQQRKSIASRYVLINPSSLFVISPPSAFDLAPTSFNPTRSTSLPIRTRQRLRRLTARHTLIQITELRIDQTRVLDSRRVALISIDTRHKLTAHDFDVGEARLARVLLLAVPARAVQLADVFGVEVLNGHGALEAVSLTLRIISPQKKVNE